MSGRPVDRRGSRLGSISRPFFFSVRPSSIDLLAYDYAASLLAVRSESVLSVFARSTIFFLSSFFSKRISVRLLICSALYSVPAHSFSVVIFQIPDDLLKFQTHRRVSLLSVLRARSLSLTECSRDVGHRHLCSYRVNQCP